MAMIIVLHLYNRTLCRNPFILKLFILHSFLQIKLSPGSTSPEEFSFTPRVAEWIKLSVHSQYVDGVIRLTEVEVYNGACRNGKYSVYPCLVLEMQGVAV